MLEARNLTVTSNLWRLTLPRHRAVQDRTSARWIEVLSLVLRGGQWEGGLPSWMTSSPSPFIQLSGYSCWQRRLTQCDVWKVPWASTRSSGSRPATRSRVSMFWRRDGGKRVRSEPHSSGAEGRAGSCNQEKPVGQGEGERRQARSKVCLKTC